MWLVSVFGTLCRRHLDCVALRFKVGRRRSLGRLVTTTKKKNSQKRYRFRTIFLKWRGMDYWNGFLNDAFWFINTLYVGNGDDLSSNGEESCILSIFIWFLRLRLFHNRPVLISNVSKDRNFLLSVTNRRTFTMFEFRIVSNFDCNSLCAKQSGASWHVLIRKFSRGKLVFKCSLIYWYCVLVMVWGRMADLNDFISDISIEYVSDIL